jgi:HEAT repeat protein
MVVRSSPGFPGLPAASRVANLNALRLLLKDRSSAVRASAADALGEFGPDPGSATDLAAATGDKDRAVRFAAARALLRVKGTGDRTATRTLVALVADPEPVPDRRVVLDVLKVTSEEVQDHAVAALAGLLTDGDLSVRPEVIECLPAAGPRARAALPALEGLLHDEDPVLRGTAGLAIATIEGNQSARAVAVLLEMVADATLPQDRRQSALSALFGFENTAALAKATPPLIRQLGDENAAIRFSALGLLSSIIGNVRAEMPGPSEGKRLSE